jgi:hypothetical protein
MLRLIGITVNLLIAIASGEGIRTNQIDFKKPPPWLTESMVEKATRPVQDFLQWDIKRIKAFYHLEEAEFQKLHRAGPTVKAFFLKTDSTLHLGPGVTAKNFQPIFAHELVHAIFFQKHKSAIPKWLEEGLANYLGKVGSVDYAWLATQPFREVATLTHPTEDPLGLRFHYQTSTALVEMISSKCSLGDLMMLSVGRKVESYLATLCEIPDVNAAYRSWVAKKQKGSKPGVTN